MTARDRAGRIALAGLGLALLLTVLLNIAVLVVPIFDMQLYDRVLTSRNMDTVTMLSVACVLGLALYGLVEYLRSACFVAIADAMGRRFDRAVLEEGIRRAASGNLQAGPQLARDLNELQAFLTSGAVAAPIDALCAPMFLIVLFMLHPTFGWLGLAGIAGLILAGVASEWLVRPLLLAAQDRRRQADQALSRSLSEPELADGLGMLPAVGRSWAARYAAAMAGLDRAGGRALMVTGASRLFRMGLQAGVMALGALLIIAGGTTPGSLMGANLLLNKLLGPYDHLVGSWRHWMLARAAWRRIRTMTSPTACVAPVPNADRQPGLLAQTVELQSEQGRTLLRGIDLHLPPGTLAVITGKNGAGKTTLLRLLAGLVGPSRGAVLLDGAPVQGGAVGYLPQSTSLLDGSIAQNIARFRDDALDDVVAAARDAGVHDLIGRMARGYDAALSNNGAALSGGLRQRIGLARALLGSPGLLILDEPDASLDTEGTTALLGALRRRCAAGAIAVITSHRPALQDAAEVEIRLEAGAVVEIVRRAAPTPRRASLISA